MIKLSSSFQAFLTKRTKVINKIYNLSRDKQEKLNLACGRNYFIRCIPKANHGMNAMGIVYHSSELLVLVVVILFVSDGGK